MLTRIRICFSSGGIPGLFWVVARPVARRIFARDRGDIFCTELVLLSKANKRVKIFLRYFFLVHFRLISDFGVGVGPIGFPLASAQK